MSKQQPRPHVPVEQRRRQLVAAAFAVMERDGAWALTTRAVATEAGVPLGAVHYAFGSKEALILAVLESDVESAVALVRAASSVSSPAGEALAVALRSYVESLRRSRLRELALQELTLMGARDPAFSAPARASIESYRNGLAAALADLARSRAMSWQPPARVVAELMFGQLVGLAQGWLTAPDEELLDDCIAAMAAHYTAYLVPAE